MITRIVEVTNADGGGINWGKFLVGWFDQEEWARAPQIMGGMSGSLLAARGHSPGDLLVLDLETCEGAVFSPGGSARADLEKHQVWVCPMFEPFLGWLYGYLRDGGRAEALPALVELPEAPSAMAGYRRPGPPGVPRR